MNNIINIKNLTIFVLLLLIVVLLIKVLYLRSDYKENISNRVITQEIDNIKYKTVAVNSNSPYKIIIGDILGIDRKAYDHVDSVDLTSSDPLLLISGIKKDYNKITTDNFFDLISNKNNVFIPDNFCLNNWPSEINKDLYENSHLSRGSFCGSEDEVILIDRLIKQYNPQKVDIYYSSETYRELLQGFFMYLDDLDIEYEIVKI